MSEPKRSAETLLPLRISPSSKLAGLLDHWQPPADAVLMVTALLVGIGGGIGAVVFRYLIRGVEWIGYDWIPQLTSQWGKAYVVFIPAIGGLLVGLLIYFLAREAKGHGVPEVMEAVALRGGRIRPIVVVVKALASSISIGSGGSVGREGPIVQIGSALGSSLGQALKLSDDRISNLVACGAAAGIAATFNAPIAGVIFALEVILGRFSVRYFSSVVVAAVGASVIGRVVFGDVPAFAIPTEYGVNSLWEFLLYPILGVLAALVGVMFTRMLYGAEDFFDERRRVPEWLKPAIGGVLLGVLALAYPLVPLTSPLTWDRMPQIFNVGYGVIEAALAGQLGIGVVTMLLILKLLATSLTLGSGGSGGVFAPTLFMGAMLGTAFALGMGHLFPDVIGAPGAYALVGMAAVFAAAGHAPITAVLILFELTGDYRIILPLMLTVVVATLLARWLLKGESIYTLKLSRRGIRLQRGRDLDVLQSVTVAEAMTNQTDAVARTMTVGDVAKVFARTHHHGLPVLDEQDKLHGIVTISDVEQARIKEVSPDTPIAEIATAWPRLKVAFPDESMGDALARMGVRGFGRMPVVAREDPYHLLGMVRRSDIVQAYNLALARRSEIQDRSRQMRTRFETETEFVEFPLTAHDKAVGITLAEIAPSLPDDCVVVSITRGERVIIPHGDTVFRAGDQITAFAHRQAMEALFRCFHGNRNDGNRP